MTIIWYSNSSGTWKEFGRNNSCSNGTYHQTNSNFSSVSKTYWWYVIVDDEMITNTSAIYHFTTRESNTFFGSASTTTTTNLQIGGIIGGGYFRMGNNSGFATRITAYIQIATANRRVKCALYDSNGNFVANSQTEEKTFPGTVALGWHQFNYSGTYPTLLAGQYYYIAAFADATNVYLRYNNGLGLGFGVYSKTTTYPNFPSIITGWTINDADGRAAIYCTYTVNENLSQYPVYPTNQSVFDKVSAGSYNVPIQMAFYSGGSRKMNATLQTNASGSWVTFNTSTNINNGTYTYSNTSWINTFNKKYWFKVILNDGMGLWNNETYSFTTAQGFPVQNDIFWAPPLRLADLTAYNGGRKIVRGSDGTLYTVYRYKYSNGGYNNIRFAKSTNNGVLWTYTNVSTDTGYNQNYPSIAINSTGGLHIVWGGTYSGSTTNEQIRYSKSSDGGVTWANPITIGVYTTRAQSVPSIAVDGNNNMYVVWHGGNSGAGATNQIRFSKSTDGGTTWSAPVNITTSIGGTYYLQQYPSIAIDNSNNLYVVWNGRYSGSSPGSLYHIRFSKSTDGGTTWSAPINISTLTTAYDQLNPCIALDNADNLRVVWYGRAVAAIAQTQIRYTASTNGGATWSAPYNISRNIAYNQQYPSIAVDNGNNIHVVWQGLHAGSTTNNQIRYSKYTASWSAPSNLTITTSYVSNFPNLLWSNYPNISGIETNIPQTGYALVYGADYNNTIYLNSTDLTWPDIPKVTTNASTGVEETNATLQGYLVNDGNATTTCGFWYDTDSGIPYAKNQTVGIVSEGNNFIFNASDLAPGQLYYFRAWAYNIKGFNSTSNEVKLLTKPIAPSVTDFKAQTNSSTKIYLTWIKGTGANTTYIERNTTQNWTRGLGTMIYNDSGISHEDTGLKPGTAYYYQAWSFSKWNPIQWSDSNSSAINTTNYVPVLSNENPTNQSTGIRLNSTLSMQVNHGNGFKMNITWYWGTDDSCPNLIGSNRSIDNGTYYMSNDNNFSWGDQTYYWKVVVNDGNGGWTNETYYFITIGTKGIISKGKNVYSFEFDSTGTILYGYVNGNSVQTSIDTNWHYVTLTYDGSQLKIYKDGEFKANTSMTGSINTNANDLLLGRYLTGTLDEVRISSTARSEAWINTTYEMTISPTSFIEVESEQNQQHTYLNITIENTGSTTIKTQDCTLLINGTKTSFVCIQTCFYPLKETNIFVNVSAVGSKRNKFITGNGIIDYEGYG